MDWQEDGTLLTIRPHGEGAAIVQLLTRARGLQSGLVRGGSSRKLAPLFQPGARMQATWRARLEEHLGTFTLDPVKSRMADVMQDGDALAALSAITSILAFALPERQPFPELHDGSELLLDMLGTSELWPFAYLRWEQAVLEHTGYGLDLSQCAVTGQTEHLIYVSPRTGRAVSAEGAGAWADRLLPLPPCLTGQPPADRAELLEALRTTGHFLHHHLATAQGSKPLPAARDRLVARLSRETRATNE